MVRAPARLHLGFLDPGASLGRRFGSLGLVIDEFETVVELARADRDRLEAGPEGDPSELERAADHLRTLRREAGLAQPLSLRLHRSLPPHAGFGSGTQLALAVGRAFAALHALALPSERLAHWLGRGLRSGVGIAGFERGGLLLDGGPGAPGEGDSVAPLLARLHFPDAWRVLLVLEPGQAGLSGAEERRAIASLPPFPRDAAAEICHRALMQILPGAAAGQLEPFAQGLTRMQQLLGGHFAPAQQGSAWTSPRVGRLLEWIGARAPAAIGQSSWGPTGFAVLPGAAEAQALVRQAAEAGLVEPGLRLHVVRARNRGADIELRPAERALARA